MNSTTPQRQTRQRAIIAEVLGELDEFKSAQDIHDLLRRRGDSIGLATVYRNLQSLAEAERVDVVRGADGQATYRACGEATHAHHHHLVCRSCGSAVEITFEGVEEQVNTIAREHGFTAVDHSIELHGLCAACSP